MKRRFRDVHRPGPDYTAKDITRYVWQVPGVSVHQLVTLFGAVDVHTRSRSGYLRRVKRSYDRKRGLALLRAAERQRLVVVRPCELDGGPSTVWPFECTGLSQARLDMWISLRPYEP